jgi:DNA-binding transcriptional LysR family regulator
LVPALPAFHARFPDLQIELRIVDHPADAQAGTCDVLILLGWSEHEHLVRRRLAQTRVLICASPAYWAAHGVPQHPRELVRHQCLLMRNPSTTVVDLWHGEFEGREESVTVSGWLLSAYRDVLLDTVLAGHGVARLTDLTVQPHLRSGRVVPVLTDWALKDAPPVNLFYRAQHRRTPKVRLFIEFVTALFQDIEAKRDAGSAGLPTAEQPFWYRHKYGRASAAKYRDA